MARESISRSTFVKGIAAGAVVACSLGALALPEYPVAKSGDYDFVPGTYSASAHGMESDVSVTITVDDHSITEVKTDVSGETQGIGAAIGDEVTSQILASQTSAIDGVAGATVSSTAVREALDAAIAKAEKGEDPVDPNAAADTEAATEAAAEDTEAQTEAAASAPASYVPGTYSASAKGMESDIPVEVTIDENGAIADVTLDVSGETPNIGAAIGDTVKEQILAAQSAEIDGVAGATVSSNAVKTALADALAQAAGGEAEEAATEAAEEAAASAAYAAGTYSASAQGMESEIPVEVTIDENGVITDVTLDVSGETPNIGAAIGDTVKEQILAAQSAEIDGVAGATVSSSAVKTALADALAQAAGGEAEAVTEAAAEEAVTEAVTEAATEAAEKDAATESVSEDAPAEAATEEETEDDSTFTGTGKGLNGDVTAKVVLDGDKIVSITLDVSGETAGIGAAIGEDMAQAMLDAQSADVDNVSGATITSEAAKAAVADALAKANDKEAAVEDASEALTEALAAAGYTAGSYTAAAKGMESDVTVTITVDETAITDVTVDVSGETPNIGAAIGDTVTEQILAAQSAEIDGVSGATVSSNAVKEALADALAQASK